MADVVQVWKEALPEVMQTVSGVGVWTALRAVVPIAFEDNTIILGLPHNDTELAGHLRLPATRRAIEVAVGQRMDTTPQLRVINGTTAEDWDTEKRRDEEKRKLQQAAINRQKQEIKAGKSWETIYDQISRTYSATPNRSLPQNRAKFFADAVDIVATALIETPITDDLAERNYARCLERVAQYADLPSTYVAVRVMERAFSG